MKESKQLIKNLNEAYAKNELSLKTFKETQIKLNDNFILVYQIAKNKKKIEHEQNTEIRNHLNAVNELLSFRSEIKEAVLQSKLIYTTFKEIEAHLNKASVYDTIGSSYYETQVLKQFIKDEIAILDRVIPQVHQNLEILEIKLEVITSHSIGFKIELSNNSSIISLAKIAKLTTEIKNQNKLEKAISLCKLCIEYISEYLSIILVEKHRISRNANYKIEEIIKLYIKHYINEPY